MYGCSNNHPEARISDLGRHTALSPTLAARATLYAHACATLLTQALPIIFCSGILAEHPPCLSTWNREGCHISGSLQMKGRLEARMTLSTGLVVPVITSLLLHEYN